MSTIGFPLLGSGGESPETVLQEHAGYVKSLALKLAPAPGLAEDIAQEVFLEFLKKQDQWDYSRPIRPLLTGIVRNIAMRCWRERQRTLSPELRELSDCIVELSKDSDVVWYSEEEKSALRQCLGKVPEKSRRIVESHYYLGVSSEEIARKLDIRANAVRQMLYRIREQLRKCIRQSLRERSHV